MADEAEISVEEMAQRLGRITTSDSKELEDVELDSKLEPSSKQPEPDEPTTPEQGQRPHRGQHHRKVPHYEGPSADKGGSTPPTDAQVNVKALLERAPYIEQIGDCTWLIKPGHLKNMNVPAKFFASPRLLSLVIDELETANTGFTAAVEQLSNVATLPGIVGESIGMPDIHSGYGFAIGNVAAFDMDHGKGVVSPGGVGFDINCGVRVVRTNLNIRQVQGDVREKLASALFEAIPVGVGEAGAVKLTAPELDEVLKKGMEWTESKGFSWPEDRVVAEEHGRFQAADPSAVSDRAKKRGRPQLGSLGSGNHYVELQAVDTIFDKASADIMGITEVGQLCVMIHTGSRGLGHQVCTDALSACDAAMAKAKVKLVDRQLACMPIDSPEGRSYLKSMAAAANFALANRSVITWCVRKAFEQVFKKTARELDMHMIYDVSHNVAKEETHQIDGIYVHVLVHRKGATRAFPPNHPDVPDKYKQCGQPILIGGSMGTASYILTGTDGAMKNSFGSTCHGAGRALSRTKAIKSIDSKDVLAKLRSEGIVVKVATKHLAAEEAPDAYKDVDSVVDTCERAGISKKVVRLVPLAVVKG